MDLFTFIKETEGLDSSLDFAAKCGLVPDKQARNCIKCGNKNSLKWQRSSRVSRSPFVFVCGVRECRATVSYCRNTMFDRLSFPLSTALRLTYFWLLKLSVDECANQLQVTKHTVVEWFQYCREVCAFIIINYTGAIGGPGHKVEVCEYQLQTKKEGYDVWILIGTDRNEGSNFTIHVEDLAPENIWPVLKNYILPESIVLTPRFKQFAELESNSNNEQLIFANPKNHARKASDYQSDLMMNDLKQFVKKEMLPNDCIELYAYQYIYFARDTLRDKPASELIFPYLNDVRQAYPGFEKERQIEYTLR